MRSRMLGKYIVNKVIKKCLLLRQEAEQRIIRDVLKMCRMKQKCSKGVMCFFISCVFYFVRI